MTTDLPNHLAAIVLRERRQHRATEVFLLCLALAMAICIGAL